MRCIRPLLSQLLCAWVVGALLLVSILGLHHNAEHLFTEHKHFGRECPVLTFGEHFTLSDATPVVPLPPALPLTYAAPIFSVVSHKSRAVITAFPRAPPVAV